jgi:hypothetical protein
MIDLVAFHHVLPTAIGVIWVLVFVLFCFEMIEADLVLNRRLGTPHPQARPSRHALVRDADRSVPYR